MTQPIYIDKTIGLERTLKVFPSIYIEGAAACGKTTAVKMLLKQHEEVKPLLLDMKQLTSKKDFARTLDECLLEMSKRACWIVLENIDRNLPAEYAELMAGFISNMPKTGRAILISRDRPQEAFIGLMWKRKMELIPQKELRFDQKEIGQMIESMESHLNSEEVYALTGGWAGCVDMMVRMSLWEKDKADAKQLRRSYEIDTYIQNEILAAFSEEELELFWRVQLCPWINEELCESVWGMVNSKDVLENMERKGIFRYNQENEYWKLTQLFLTRESLGQTLLPSDDFWEDVGKWYEQNGYIREALECYGKMSNRSSYRECLLRNYQQVLFLEQSYEEVLHWKENTPEVCYIRGMYYYFRHELKNLDHEIEKLEKMDLPEANEILLNLYFAKPDFPLDDWLEMLEKRSRQVYLDAGSQKHGKLHLYNMLGTSCTFLCGIRDLTELFACTKKEENRKARLWHSCLGEREWKCYQLARLDYYLETMRSDVILGEDYNILLKENFYKKQKYGVYEEQFDLARLYLIGKLQRIQPSQEHMTVFQSIGMRLIQTETPLYVRNAEALINIYSLWQGKAEQLTRWLQYKEGKVREKVTEETAIELWCMAKGYLLLNQYEKAEKILRALIPYQKSYRRARVLAEAWFLQALVNWGLNRRGQALQNMIESFLISRVFRYVDFYTLYGKQGREMLEVYMQWHQANFPERWRRKKKYQYGNVLRMPLEDYMAVVLRRVRKGEKRSHSLQDEAAGERLTMMELLILQKIRRGLSNLEICEELNLKMPTVKSHIYNMYKKLGVSSRMQAVIKGKEMGVLE